LKFKINAISYFQTQTPEQILQWNFYYCCSNFAEGGVIRRVKDMFPKSRKLHERNLLGGRGNSSKNPQLSVGKNTQL
jgi:hypothetical protein